MRVYFQTSNKMRRLIGQPHNRAEAYRIITQFVDDHNYRSYYFREWKENDEIWIDAGSWSEFFILIEEG